MDFDYAHKDTSEGERETPTAPFNKAVFNDGVEEMLRLAALREIPVSDRETLTFLTTLLSALQPKNILEIGTAVGVSASAMLYVCENAHITTVEKNKKFYAEALQNFEKQGFTERVSAISGDAGEVLPRLSGPFDFIFLDGAKVQYVKYIPQLKRLLRSGGTLLADDVLLYGYVSGERETPKKRKMLVEHIKEYLSAIISDSEFRTVVINAGNGLAMSVKI